MKLKEQVQVPADLLVMTQTVARLRSTMRRTAWSVPIFDAALTRWPLPIPQTSSVSFFIAGEMSRSWVIPRNALSSAAASKPIRLANLSPMAITGVVST